MLPRDGRQDDPQRAPGPEPTPPNFIHVYPDAISREQCAEIIEKFEADPRVRPSWGSDSDRPKNRSGAMLAPGKYPEWAEITHLIKQVVRRRIDHYASTFTAVQRILITDDWELSSPLIERIEPSQGFDWHFDGNLPGTERRVLATILYLTDIEDGGATQFAYQNASVQPRAGALVIFPPFWTHLHRGETPRAGVKYNVTNFLSLKKSSLVRTPPQAASAR